MVVAAVQVLTRPYRAGVSYQYGVVFENYAVTSWSQKERWSRVVGLRRSGCIGHAAGPT